MLYIDLLKGKKNILLDILIKINRKDIIFLKSEFGLKYILYYLDKHYLNLRKIHLSKDKD
jgi:hypothetical protein